MQSVKKSPQRMCIACREMKDKFDLFRIVVKDGNVSLDLTGKAQGRGYYVCKCQSCIDKVSKNKSLAKSCGFTFSNELLTEMEKIIEQ